MRSGGLLVAVVARCWCALTMPPSALVVMQHASTIR